MGRRKQMNVGGREKPINVCRRCGRTLTDIVEEYKGTDHVYFDKGRYVFTVDIPQGRMEGTSHYSCFYCGTPLTKKQVQWMEERKD